ncbi:hypothetical protein D9M71_582410 [compost metagenome]
MQELFGTRQERHDRATGLIDHAVTNGGHPNARDKSAHPSQSFTAFDAIHRAPGEHRYAQYPTGHDDRGQISAGIVAKIGHAVKEITGPQLP